MAKIFFVGMPNHFSARFHHCLIIRWRSLTPVRWPEQVRNLVCNISEGTI